MSRVLVILITVISFLCASSGFTSEKRWLDRKAEGWFWYETEPELPEQSQSEQTPPAPSSIQPTPMHDHGPVPLSSAWIRDNMQVYLDTAIDDPSPENIAAFLYIQRYAMDKSFAFMDASQEATLGNPAFDEITRRPIATFANRRLDESAAKQNKRVVENISASAGLFFFVDDSDASITQAEVVAMLERNYSFNTVTISVVDLPVGHPISGARKDNGHAQLMNVASFPSLVLLRSDGLFDAISQAPVSYADLQRRILVGAKRLGIITETEFNSTRPINKIPLVPTKLPPSQTTVNSPLPIPTKQIVSAFSRGIW